MREVCTVSKKTSTVIMQDQSLTQCSSQDDGIHGAASLLQVLELLISKKDLTQKQAEETLMVSMQACYVILKHAQGLLV